MMPYIIASSNEMRLPLAAAFADNFSSENKSSAVLRSMFSSASSKLGSKFAIGSNMGLLGSGSFAAGLIASATTAGISWVVRRLRPFVGAASLGFGAGGATGTTGAG